MIELTTDYVNKLAPVRSDEGNKGTFGKVLIVAGSKFMTGVLKLADPNAARPLSHVAKFTVSGWMRDATSTETGYRMLMSKGAWQNDGWAVNTQNNRTSITATGYYDKTKQWNFPSGKTLNGQWHHLTVSYNNGTVQFWLDGAKLDTVSSRRVAKRAAANISDITVAVLYIHRIGFDIFLFRHF